jgi:hypothetical protein
MDIELTIWACILSAPVIAFFLVRKFKGGLFHKILGGVATTLALATLFYYLATAIILFFGFLIHGI